MTDMAALADRMTEPLSAGFCYGSQWTVVGGWMRWHF